MKKTSNKDNRGYVLDALARRLERNAEIDDIRQANSKKRRAFMGGALRIDDCLYDDNGNEKESSLLSDGGRGAAVIRKMREEVYEDLSWLVEFRRVVASLNEIDQRIVAALMQDLRPQNVARLAMTNRQRVYRLIDKLSVALKPAHQMWKRRFP
jgi:hypothetical protein